LLAQVIELDRVAESVGLDEEGWALRYHLEDQLILADRMDDEYWHQRSRTKWLLQGDACTAYLHAITNGKRRKCGILRHVTDGGEISERKAHLAHVYNFYR
jgi:hypothetical protein